MFKNARIKLTLWYLLIIMFISIAFSLFIHRVSVMELERFARIQRIRIVNINPYFSPPPRFDPDLIQETKDRITLILVLINAIIFVVSGGTGYILAGKTLKPIQDMMDEQNRFVSDASHELRTPLTSLKTAMEVGLRNKNFNIREARNLIRENILEVNKLDMLSSALLQLSQSQHLSNKSLFDEISLDLAIKEAVQKISILAKVKNIRIKADKIKPVTVLGDKNQLVESFVILLDNAVKYSHKNSTIYISANNIKKTAVEIIIKDEGIGIAESDLPHVFHRFYRADSARQKNDPGGFGLGLPIAREIILHHKGKINIESKINIGTQVRVILPLVHY